MRKTGAAALIAAALILLPVVVMPATASTFVGGTNAWTLVALPSTVTLRGSPTTEADFLNDLNATTLGIVLLVVHNSGGQTVYITAGTVSIQAGTNSTAYLTIFGLSSGTYSASVFVMLPSGTAISVPTTVTVSI